MSIICETIDGGVSLEDTLDEFKDSVFLFVFARGTTLKPPVKAGGSIYVLFYDRYWRNYHNEYTDRYLTTIQSHIVALAEALEHLRDRASVVLYAPYELGIEKALHGEGINCQMIKECVFSVLTNKEIRLTVITPSPHMTEDVIRFCQSLSPEVANDIMRVRRMKLEGYAKINNKSKRLRKRVIDVLRENHISTDIIDQIIALKYW